MNKTKIITTIGPASSDINILKELIEAGTDVIRLNMSHANHDFCKQIIKKVNEINDQRDNKVAIMVDLKGPCILTGKFTGGSAFLKKDDKIRIYMDDIIGDNTKFSVSYPNLINNVKCNTELKINDGRITLMVVDKGSDYLLCQVMTEGIISDFKSVNVPGVKLNIPFLSDKDRDDIKFAHEMNADFLALSFVSSSEDVLEANDLLIEYGNDHIGIISKIENESAIDEIDDIIKVSDGIMIARGDLGVEIPFERVPGIQKNIINKCHTAGIVSIVATEMLSTMENDIRPTRAEVSDVANAVMDSVDSVMLSGETTVGKYPVETVDMMARIIDSAERDINYYDLLDKAMRTENQDVTGSIAYSVADCSNRLKCSAIVAPTMSGYTAKKMSRFRPYAPIIAVSPSEQTVKSLALHFGVYAVMIDELKSFDRIMNKSKIIAQKVMNLEEGDRIILTGGYPFKEVKHTNFMKIEEI